MSHIVTNTQTPWACLRHPEQDLFYWVHSKCACSFYKKIFKGLGWVDCSTLDIEWGVSKVFSHIRDPKKKHRTGIIEYFYYNQCQKILESNKDNEDFWIMLSKISWLDWHSLTIWEHLGDRMNLLHWIPIDVADLDHVQESLDFIVYTGDRTWIQRISKINVSTGFKKHCVEKLMQLVLDPLIVKYLEKDQQLYDKIVTPKGFQPRGYEKQIQLLKSKGLDQISAESIVDQQVADGSYVTWDNQ